jgi:hypothetical protein
VIFFLHVVSAPFPGRHPGFEVSHSYGSDEIQDYTLLCNRTLLHKNLANDLNAGQYHCVAQDVTVGGNPVGASLEGHLDIVSGSNGTNS